MVLVVDCCIREEESRTRKLYLEYLKENNLEYEVLYLTKLNIKPLDKEMIKKRDMLVANKEYDNPMFDLAWQFNKADKIIVAAPYYDLSFPSLLKVYFENVSVLNINFTYSNKGELIGLAHAKELLYFSTIGGYLNGPHLGYEYVKALAEMFGINNTKNIYKEGLDI
ncbi:MAG: NAD(P)H-dependent oxidoreductase [Acholeplasmatales bacterium]|nr:NAD(P)H-dependent oxidoreductase [Acholeplasmatales bacterium]